MTAVLRRMTWVVLMLTIAGVAVAQQPLDYWQYTATMRAAMRLDLMTTIDSLEDDRGPVVALGDRFGLVRLLHVIQGQTLQLWASKQLNGQVREVISADMDGDGKDEFLAWTTAGHIYLWSAHDQRLLWESLTNDFQVIHAVTIGQVDDDPALEIVINSDRRIHYVDGESYSREWTSPFEYECTRMSIGDVDGDGSPEIVLTTGQVVDARSGDVEWDGENFGSRIELIDIDADGIPEILAESDGVVLRIFDADVQREKHLQ